MDSWKITGIISTAVIVVMIPLSLILHSDSSNNERNTRFVGGDKCTGCHQREYELWKQSDHAHSMAPATDSTVLGNFNNTEVEFRGIRHRFYKRDGKFFIYTAGADGMMKEFEVTYTFGIRPLQQYLVPFSGGRLQCLPIAWDTDKKRWFDMAGMIYTQEELEPDSWFYWTNQSQNWNGMCAECHSTNLIKNYDYNKSVFNTTWSDINVNCEACHGPGSDHLDWARLPEGSRDNDGNKGLVLRSGGITSKQYIEACAPCHSRRTAFGPNEHIQNSYYELHRPQDIVPPFYHPDGQIKDEVYEFGSFTQSKMYMKDVRCNDCHDSHSLRLKFEGNALCNQCHRPEEYDTHQHHFHKYANDGGSPVRNKFGQTAQPGTGALCINCHMPANYYMGIDLRRDHSFRIPRPDLSIKYNVPNTCNDCHAGQSYQWAENYIKKFYGEKKKYTYTSILAEGHLRKEGADKDLIRLIRSDLYPEIIKAAAIRYLSAYSTSEADSVIREMLFSPEAVIRERSVDVFNTNDPEDLVKTITPLLSDPVRLVRISAALKLSVLRKEYFTEDQYKLLSDGLEDYLASVEYTADFPTGLYNLGNYYSNKGEPDKAGKYYLESLKGDNRFYPAKVNLALLYYNNNELDKAERIYLDLINNHPEFDQGEYSLGLLYAEQKKYPEAALMLQRAILRNNNPRIYYNLGLIYQYINDDSKSEYFLLKAYSSLPGEYDAIYALADFYIKKKNFSKALQYADELKIKFPGRAEGQYFINYIRNQENTN